MSHIVTVLYDTISTYILCVYVQVTGDWSKIYGTLEIIIKINITPESVTGKC